MGRLYRHLICSCIICGTFVLMWTSHFFQVLSVAGKGYAFDHIFTDVCGQASVYEESVRPVVKKFCAGFNCAVIAYGRTGTGKTYTMGTDPKV
jgi:hypothetical protein